MRRFALILAFAFPLFAVSIVDHWFMAVETTKGMRALQTAVEAYNIDHKSYPKAATIDELQGLIEPIYIRTTPRVDAWGTPFDYTVSADGKSYTIASAGSDKVFDRGSWTGKALLTSSKDDQVYGAVDREW